MHPSWGAARVLIPGTARGVATVIVTMAVTLAGSVTTAEAAPRSSTAEKSARSEDASRKRPEFSSLKSRFRLRSHPRAPARAGGFDSGPRSENLRIDSEKARDIGRFLQKMAGTVRRRASEGSVPGVDIWGAAGSRHAIVYTLPNRAIVALNEQGRLQMIEEVPGTQDPSGQTLPSHRTYRARDLRADERQSLPSDLADLVADTHHQMQGVLFSDRPGWHVTLVLARSP
jgi:hypothetical protein